MRHNYSALLTCLKLRKSSIGWRLWKRFIQRRSINEPTIICSTWTATRKLNNPFSQKLKEAFIFRHSYLPSTFGKVLLELLWHRAVDVAVTGSIARDPVQKKEKKVNYLRNGRSRGTKEVLNEGLNV